MSALDVRAVLSTLYGSPDAQAREQAQRAVFAERSRRGAWLSHRALLAERDETLLFFFLSLCEAALAEHWPLPPPERQQLKEDLHVLLLASPPPPPSAVGKAVQILASLGRLEWPAEDGAFLSRTLQLLERAGPSRSVGARLLAAVGEEFDPAAHRALSARKSELQAALGAELAAVWRALSLALQAEEAITFTAAADDAPLLCLRACRALLAWAPLGGADVIGGDAAAAELGALLDAASRWLHPRAGGAACACAALDVVAELMAPKVAEARQSPLVAPLVARLLAPLGTLLQTLQADAAAGAADGGGAGGAGGAAVPGDDAYAEKLVYVLQLLGGRWLLRLAPSDAPSLLRALCEYGAARPLGLWVRCVGAAHELLDAAFPADDAALPAGVGHWGDALADVLLDVGHATAARLQLTRTPELAVALGVEPADADGAALWGGGGAEAASDDGDGDARAADGAAAAGGVDGDDDGFGAFAAPCAEFFGRLAVVRPNATLLLLADALAPLLPAALGSDAHRTDPATELTPAHAAAAFDAGTLATLLTAVAPAALASSGGAAVQLAALLVATLRGSPLCTAETLAAAQRAPGEAGGAGGALRPPLWRCLEATLRLLLVLCEWLSAQPEVEGASGEAAAAAASATAAASSTAADGAALLESALGVLLPALLLLTYAAEAPGAAAVASSLLVRASSRRWPRCVHDGAGLTSLRQHAATAAAGTTTVGRDGGFHPYEPGKGHAPAGGARRRAALAAAACALLLPPRATEMRAYADALGWRRDHARALLAQVMRPLVTFGADPAAVVPAGHEYRNDLAYLCPRLMLAPAEVIESCRAVAAILDAFSEEHRAVKAELSEAAAAPALAAVEALLGATARLAAGSATESGGSMMEDALPVIGALLELLRAVVGSVGGVLGGAFVAGCLRATLGALETVLGALPPRPPQREIDGFLRAALSLLRLAADPPVARPSDRSELLALLVGLVGPAALGALLSRDGGGPPPLSPPRRAQLFGVVAAALKAHWQEVRHAELLGRPLLELLGAALAAADDGDGYRVALRALGALQFRSLSGRAEEQPWLEATVAEHVGFPLCAVILSPAHAHLHEESVGVLHHLCREWPVVSELGVATVATVLLRECLVRQAPPLAAAERDGLLDAFGAAAPTDGASFALAVARLANDASHLRLARDARLGGWR